MVPLRGECRLQRPFWRLVVFILRNAPSDLPQYLAQSFENPAHLHWANGILGLELYVHTRGSGAVEPRQGGKGKAPPTRQSWANKRRHSHPWTSLPRWTLGGLGVAPTQLGVVSLENEGADDDVKDLETPLM